MRKLFLLAASVIAAIINVHAAVTLDADLQAALPSGEFFLPAPPEVGSLIWKDDSAKYYQYKELARRFDEEKQECWDSIWALMNEQYYFALYRLAADSVMNAPFIEVEWTKGTNGKYTVTQTPNNTDFPEMNKLRELCEVMKTENTSHLWRTRPRPYCFFGEWYKGKKYTAGTTSSDSYPSGHGYFAGLFGMCMLYIAPEKALEINNMMNEWLNCRLLLGAHWKTDLDAGKQLGAIAFAIAMNHAQFRNQVEAAKTEWQNYRDTHYTRSHPHMNLNTFCFPYQIDSYTGAEFYTMLYKETDDNEKPVAIYLQGHEGALEAGRPYFYVPESGSAQLVCTYSGVYHEAGNDGNGVYGVYEDLTDVAPGMYVTYNNLFTKAGTNVKLHEYRAYINMDEVSTDAQNPAYIPGRKQLKISGASEVATDINAIQARRPENTKVLNNGRLLIFSDSKSYNAAGQEQ